MKKALLYIGIALAAIGCTKDAGVDTPSGDNPLTFTSNITTRADKSEWADTDAIGVYMTSTDFGDGGENKEYTTNGDGKFSSTDPLYLPASGSAKIFAYYPYVDGVDYTAYPITSSEQVDILSATNDDVSSSNVSLTFNHLLSKVSLTIAAGDGLELADLDGLAVTISGIYTEATFDLTKGKVNNDLSGDTSLELTTADDGTSSSAIVIPQSLSGATLFFTTSGDNGKTYSAAITTKEFKTSLEYTYAITIKENGVEITSANINSWEEGEATSGTASATTPDIAYNSTNSTYEIYTGVGLKAFAAMVDNSTLPEGVVTSGGDDYFNFTSIQLAINGQLMNDIDLSTVCSSELGDWTPIGGIDEYQGIFDGGGYEVKSIYINNSSYYQGLFGYTSDATIKNVGVSGEITARDYVGGVASNAYGTTTITNCYNKANITATGSAPWFGGVASYTDPDVVIANCYNAGKILATKSNASIGGVVGYNYATLTNCYNSGEVSTDGTTTNIGSVVGCNAGDLNYCYYGTTVNTTLNGIGSDTKSQTADTDIAEVADLTSEDFVTTLNNNAYSYNNPTEGSKPTVAACAWNDNSTNDYPTLDFGETPTETGSYD